jgi:hypothetical protein
LIERPPLSLPLFLQFFFCVASIQFPFSSSLQSSSIPCN